LSEYIQTGQIRYEFRHFPLYSIHPQADLAAQAAECAGEQGSFWEMHDALFDAQQDWAGAATAGDTFKALAGNLDLDQAQFDACLDGEKYADQVQADFAEGSNAGVSGTPAFRINGTELSGAQPFSAFQKQIDYFLAGGEPPSLEVAADSYRSMGEAGAPVVITAFSDYQCPACAQVEATLMPELIARYVDTGQARFVFRQFPLTQIHPYAPQAAQAAVCAGEQGSYWEMHEKLFAGQSDWSGAAEVPLDIFEAYAREIGLEVATFVQCLASEGSALAVQADVMAGEMLGINATPTFLVNDLPLRGGASIGVMGQVIEYMAAGGVTPQIVPAEGSWRTLGDVQTARAAMLAFVDYASPESAEHALNVLPQLREQYIDPGTLIYVLHSWVESTDGLGTQAAVAAECAAEQDKAWEMHSLLFENQEEWMASGDLAATFEEYAASLGMDVEPFAACLDTGAARTRVQAGTVVGAMIGVPGAPVYVFSNGQSLDGSSGLDDFEAMINSMIGQ
jgi:protein-disulfide isomerase